MRRFLVAAVALVVALSGPGPEMANAASLHVNTTPEVFLMKESACAPGTASGTPVIHATAATPVTAGSFSAVSLSEVPAPCHGLPVDVYVHTTSGNLVTSGAGTVGTAATAVAVGNYNATAVTTVIVRIGGWLFPTTWAAPAAPTAPLVSNCVMHSQVAGISGPCHVTFTLGPVQTSPQGQYQALAINVTHSVSQPQYWSADFNFAKLPGLVVEPTRLGADWLNASAPAGCSAFPEVTLRAADYQFSLAMYIGEFPSYRPTICG